MKQKYLYLIIIVLSILSLFSVYKLSDRNIYKYDFIAKRVQIDDPNKALIKFVNLRESIENYVNKLDSPKDVSIYFEYLPTGVSIKINENTEQVAASLMKVPVIMDIYKAKELGYIDLNKKIQLKSEWLNDEYGTLYQKGAGYELSTQEAVNLVLSESDNTAFLAIWDTLNQSKLEYTDKSLNYLDVNYNIRKDERAEISPESYSSILKCLYFSCFNNINDSNEILRILTTSKFNDRLTKLLPSDVKVAHKIGSFSEINQSDCGIIYLERKNYILCIMVKDTNTSASKIIAEISYIIFEKMKQIQ